ncbi:MAG: hypothetical protein ACK410_01085 [Acinetobacter sp.]
MNQNLEHDRQASSEIRKKELNRKRLWNIFKWVIPIARVILKVFFLDSNDLDNE